MGSKVNALPNRGCALDWRKSSSGRPTFGGIYVFWWNGSARDFYRRIENRVLCFRGSQSNLRWKLRPRDLVVAPNGGLPLYVGKTSRDIAGRVGLHLKLKTERMVLLRDVGKPGRKMTTSCQVRDRLDRLFPRCQNTAVLALDCLMLSYLRLDESPHAAVERFFLEDYAIGVLHPVFNVDVER